jgi:GIY-YIG catalytic domain
MEYQNGKIYTIRSFQTEKYYIGSTNHKTLSQRLSKHKSNYRDWLRNNDKDCITSFEILKYDDCYIELLELYPCNLKAELHKREGELIRIHKDSLVNRCIPCRTVKEYLIDNKEILAVKAKQRGNIYRVDNKQKIRDYKTQPYHCECGRVIQLDKKARHCTSNIHIDLIKQNEKITISQEEYDLLVYCDSLMLSSNSYTNFIISQ